ncbi:MAG TPA: response regulator [Myxococcales bacterium]
MSQTGNHEQPQRFHPRHAPRVLLAEDDPEMRALMAWTLRADGYEVQEVGDGDELLRALGTVELGEGGPDVVVTDVQMPGVSGLEVLERVRRSRARLPVLLVTAFGDWETHARAEQLGAEVLDKPIELDDLRKRVFDAVEL